MTGFTISGPRAREHDIAGDAEQPQPSTESIPTDPQTDVMHRHLAEDQLYIKIIYDLGNAPMISKEWQNDDNFPTEVLHFSRQRSLPEIFTHLADFVVQRLEHQEKECYNTLNRRDSEHFLLLRPELIHDCQMKQRAFEFDDSGVSRIRVVNDLLSGTVDNAAARRGEDADEQTRQPQLTIKLRLIDVVKRSTITDPLVVIRSGAEAQNTGGGALFYRIGFQAVPDEEEVRLVDMYDALFWRRNLNHDSTGLTIVTASMWSLRDLDICNPDEGLALGKDTPRLEQETTETPSDAEGFKKALRSGSAHPYTKGRLLYDFKAWCNLDILPGYTLEPLEKLPKKVLTVATRYYSHLPFEET